MLEELEIIYNTADKSYVTKSIVKIVPSRQDSYSDQYRKGIEYENCDKVFLRVSPRKGIIWFEDKDKLNPWYIRQDEITERVWSIAYELIVPLELTQIHKDFYDNILRWDGSNPLMC